MANERFRIISGAYLILIKDKKVLLSRRCNTGYCDGKWGLPAGHLEENETIMHTAVREGEEEIGIKINAADLRLVHVMHRMERDGTRLNLFFAAEKWDGEPKNAEPEKCDNVCFFGINSLPENITPYVKQAIDNMLKKIPYSEHGWNSPA